MSCARRSSPPMTEPRFATPRTPERETLGRAAARVARVLGQPLMPWQRMVVDVALEVNADGRLVYRDVTLTVPRQQGKSFLILVLMLTRALLAPRQGIAYTAQSGLDARKKLLDDWTPMVRASVLGSQVRSYLAPGRESLTVANGSQIQLIASTAKSGHGRVLDVCFLDEAFSYPDSRTEQALRPAQMTRPDPQLWVVSTAGTPDASPYLLDRVERGRQAVEGGAREGLCYFEYSAEDGADPADPATWRSCMPALGHTVTEDAVRSAQGAMGRSEFSRAYLNRWVSSLSDPIIPLERWEALADPNAPRPSSLILAVDIAPRSKSASIAAAGIQGGRLHVSVLEHGPGTDWVARKLEDLRDGLHGCEVIVDPRACSAIVPEIDHLGLVEVDAAELAAGCAFVLDLAQRDRLRHRGEPELMVALDGAAQRPLGDSWAWSRKSSGVDISPLVAVTLACWGWRWDPIWGAQ
jgi:phage terminase large subunit-like protein